MDEQRLLEIETALRKVATIIADALAEVGAVRQDLVQPSLDEEMR